MPLNFDVVRDFPNLSPGATTDHLYSVESSSMDRWRAVEGHRASVTFQVTPTEAGRIQLLWNWFSVVDDQEGQVSIDGHLIPGTLKGVPLAELVPGNAVISPAPGPHRIDLTFSRIRPPTAAGDARPIPVALTMLSVQQLVMPPVSPTLRAGTLLLALVVTWLLWRGLLRGGTQEPSDIVHRS